MNTTTINLYHAAFGDNGFVAKIEVESGEIEEMLERAYAKSQNIHSSWVESEDVMINPSVKAKGLRSTSCDDYMLIGANDWYKVSGFGFDKINIKNEIIERRITSPEQLAPLLDYYDNGERGFVGEPMSLAVARFYRDGYTQGR